MNVVCFNVESGVHDADSAVVVGQQPHFAAFFGNDFLRVEGLFPKLAQRVCIPELSGLRVVAVGEVIIKLHPYISIFVLVDMVDAVAFGLFLIAVRQSYRLEVVSVEFAQSVPGAEPHEALLVLEDIHDVVLRQSVFCSEMLERTVELGGCTGETDAKQDRNEKEYFT